MTSPAAVTNAQRKPIEKRTHRSSAQIKVKGLRMSFTKRKEKMAQKLAVRKKVEEVREVDPRPAEHGEVVASHVLAGQETWHGR